MEIVADQNIPHVEDAFAQLGNVKLYPGREITNNHLTNCECLLVRTVTKVNEQLLKNTPIKFVGTATIGVDHIHLDYLSNSKIGFSNAAGCNAEAASEYVISGLFALSANKGFNPFALKAGIVGLGNVGSRLYHKLSTLGIDCVVTDPLLDNHKHPGIPLVDIDQLIQECDLISLHVPLTNALTSTHPTYHLFDKKRLEKLKDNTVLINAARGEVIDNDALATLLNVRGDLTVFLDTWENEPEIKIDLLNKVDLATPHIAGYSVEGRLRGTQMILEAAANHFDMSSTWSMETLLPPKHDIPSVDALDKLSFWQNVFSNHFNIWRDDTALRNAANDDQNNFATAFDGLRKVYLDRLEYDRFTIKKSPKLFLINSLRLWGLISNRTYGAKITVSSVINTVDPSVARKFAI